ncbi:MAG: hypothetical protein AMJ43_00475 [Coxiella sp. DG_40]|nr:MAG: hypothetical protein AMJ43_00475 [Coxiella sp. DG_40]
MCSRGILELSEEHFKAVNAAIADACLATIKAVGAGKVAFINLAIDISRGCDCLNYTDMPIIPDLGVFASYDPVAIDKACVDKAAESAGVPGSMAEDMDVLESGKRKFETCSPLLAGLSEETQLNTGEIIGLGTRQYELVPVAEKKMEDFAFSPDPRPVGVRLSQVFAKLQPFPYDWYEGKGFLREEEVDLEHVNTYYDDKR